MDASYICYLQLVDYLLYDMICYVSGLVEDYCPIYLSLHTKQYIQS
jgi:hypothetical protein